MDRRNVFMEEDTRQTEVVDIVPKVPKQNYSLRAQREAVRVMEDAYLGYGHLHCSAVLHRSAMEDTGSLAMTAARLSQLTPEASLHYWKLVGSFVESASKYLERW